MALLLAVGFVSTTILTGEPFLVKLTSSLHQRFFRKVQSLGNQNWKSRDRYEDTLSYLLGALDLVNLGKLPDRGDVSSFSSYNPPGPAWLAVPGVLVFDDPRLFESIGAGAIYVATLLGIGLLARKLFGTSCALLAIVLYGFTGISLTVASSLWPRFPIQCFFVWMVYWTLQWVTLRKPWYLCASIVTWAAGMYMFMEMAPALLILPAVWLAYRPPLQWGPVVAAGFLSLLIWFPYLRFEQSRNFIDIRSLVSKKNLQPDDFKANWCDRDLDVINLPELSAPPKVQSEPAEPGTEAQTVDEPESPTSPAPAAPAPAHPGLVRAKLGNLLQYCTQISGNVPYAGALLLLVTVASLFLVSVPRTSFPPTVSGGATPEKEAPSLRVTGSTGLEGRWTALVESVARPRTWDSAIALLAGGMVLIGLLANLPILARLLDRSAPAVEDTELANLKALRIIAIVIGLVILVRKPLATAIARLAKQTSMARPLVLCLLVPALILLALAEPGRSDRFWWLWPVQAVVVAALATRVVAQLSLPREVAYLGCIALMVIVVGRANGLWDHAAAWVEESFGGQGSDLFRAADFIADKAHAAGLDQVVIGYQYPMAAAPVVQNVIDPRYKVGADCDLYFRCRHRITNASRCPEGQSPEDQFRIVKQITQVDIDNSKISDDYPRCYVDGPIPDDLRLVQQFGDFGVYERVGSRTRPGARPPAYRPGMRIDFARASARGYLLKGWYGREPEGRWSGPEASLQLDLEEVRPLRLRVMAHAYGQQKCVVRLNGQVVGAFTGHDERRELHELALPAHLLKTSNILTFQLPDAHSPKSTGQSTDDRVLGIYVAWIELTPSPPQSPGP